MSKQLSREERIERAMELKKLHREAEMELRNEIPSNRRGRKEGWETYTAEWRPENIGKVRHIAVLETGARGQRVEIKEILDEAIEALIRKYEKKHGPLKVFPPAERRPRKK